jgi:hypothetical protein
LRATEIVRSILDLLDKLEQPQTSFEPGSDDTDSRFRQIYAILQNRKPVSTEPNETVSGVDSVTTLAGGGVNGPKHSDDIRVKDPRGYRT